MFDFNEIETKDGKRIVFCRFTELIPEAFGCTQDELESGPSGGKGEYIGHCPFCKAEGHKKHKLYLKDDLTVGHCFVCNRAFSNITDEVKINFEIPDFFDTSAFNSRVLDLHPLNDPEWTLDKYWLEFDDYSEKGVKYLEGRHPFMKDLWGPLEFKFLNDNVVIPFKYHSQLFYYQIRFTGKSKIRYFHPHIDAGCKPPYIIENGNCKKFILCEGVFDAISLLIQAPDFTPMAVLGHELTDYQLAFLREYIPEVIYVMMDETELSQKIADKVKSVIDYAQVKVIKTAGPDPEEILNYRIRRRLPLNWIK